MTESGDSETITLPIKLPGLNEYIDLERLNKYKSAKLKRMTQDDLGLLIRHEIAIGHLHRHSNKVSIVFDWYEPNNRRDCDNVSFAQKFVLDALVENGVFPDDSRKYIEGIAHRIATDKGNPRVVLHILEREDRKCLQLITSI